MNAHRTKTKPSKTSPLASAPAPAQSRHRSEDPESDRDDAADTSDANEQYGSTAKIVLPRSGGVKLLEQNHTLQEVLRSSMDQVLIDFAFEDAYHTVSSRAVFVRPILVSAARKKKANEIKNRAKADISFAKTFAPLVSRSSTT